MLVSHAMADRCNLIDKDHYIGLQHFGGVGKVTNVTKAEQRHDLLPRNHHVDNSWILNDSANNLGAGLAEPHSQQ
jgi:hypothetical protein